MRLQAELWYQRPADTTEKRWFFLKNLKENKRERHNNTTYNQGKCLQDVEQPETKRAVQYEPKLQL